MRRPNLFIIGAMKSGTTSLHQYLSEHPEICMSTLKEPSYFLTQEEVRDVYFEAYTYNFWKSEDRYLALFKDTEGKRIIGESSTNYTKMNRVACCAPKIHDYNPDAKFIYLMRDPVHRAISHFLHEVRWGGEKRRMLAALKEDPHYIETSDYAFQIAPFLDLFDSSHFFFTTTEVMERDPVTVFREICLWLGVDATFVPPSLGARVHETPEDMLVPRGAVSEAVIRAYRTMSTKTGFKEPQALRSFLLGLVKRPTSRTEARSEEPAAIEYLRPIMREKVARLSSMLGRDFPEWRSLAPVERIAS